jgi:uncharacterized membrane protein YvbJ
MFCLNCGKELPDDAKFCSGCGKQIEAKEKEIINKVPVCSSCGEELIPGNKFCIKCGTPVNTPSITNISPPAETFVNITPEPKIQKEEEIKEIGVLSPGVGRVLFILGLLFSSVCLWAVPVVGGIGCIILCIIVIIQTIRKKNIKNNQ